MASTDKNIIVELRHLARTSQPVDVLNVYQGLPVMYRMDILKVGEDRAVVGFHQPEAVCLQIEGKTTLLTELLEAPVNAAVLELDLPGGRATLHDFRYAFNVGHRMIVRVMPGGPVAVTLGSGAQQFAGTLIDIGMAGVGLVLPQKEAVQALRRQAVVQLRLNLDGEALLLSGTVRYARAAADGLRVGLTLVQTAEARSLYRYIHARQEAILEDLRARYREARGPGSG